MNPCAIHQSAYPCCEETRREAIACPKPHRISSDHDQPIWPLKWQFGNQTEMNDLFDIIMTKGGCGVEQHRTQISSSPPFFCGSPPARVANPLIKDEHFKVENFAPFSLFSPASAHLPSSPRKVGLVRPSFDNKPALRIEGFDYLNRDGRNIGIPAWA